MLRVTADARSLLCLKLHWELGSQLLGALLRLFAPTDTYTVTKARGPAHPLFAVPRGMSPAPPPPTLPQTHTRPPSLSPLPYHPQVGKRLRCDGTLLGLEDTRGLIPRWKCGRFTLLVDVGAWPAHVILLR